jgi:hypothetical protein
MVKRTISFRRSVVFLMCATGTAAALAACGGNGTTATSTPTEAVGVTLSSTAATTACTASSFSYPGATITSATLVAAGAMEATGSTGSLTVAVPEYCKVIGKLNERVSPVDGNTYSIGFEMRFPTAWNGRFFHQVNGGLDGTIVNATGDILGGGQASSGLTKGFVTLSSNAGHIGSQTGIAGGLFGKDPQARLDYGYNAVAALTPMAKSLIKNYFGKNPDKSYMVGTSNGGRHTMVTASRLGDQYDGFLASAPGFNLPKAAVAQLWGAQQLATISAINSTTLRPDILTSFSNVDLKLVSDTIITKCDALDGLADGQVNDLIGCQATFNLMTDVPTCTTGTSDGTCLTYGQKSVLAKMQAGAENSAGSQLYTKFFWSDGIWSNRNDSPTNTNSWRAWKMIASTTNRDPLSVAFVFMNPPVSPTVLTGAGTTLLDYALNWNGTGFNVDTDASKIFATNSTYTESAMSFMTPPDLTMSKMVANHGKMMLVHGAADPVFSVNDTINWYDSSFKAKWGTAASSYARLFIVPGMLHSRGGPATDQYDMVDALVNWVEKGIAPESVTAKARNTTPFTGSSLNADVPASWGPGRTRPLCPYPAIAKYNGSGSIEDAANFSCVAP